MRKMNLITISGDSAVLTVIDEKHPLFKEPKDFPNDDWIYHRHLDHDYKDGPPCHPKTVFCMEKGWDETSLIGSDWRNSEGIAKNINNWWKHIYRDAHREHGNATQNWNLHPHNALIDAIEKGCAHSTLLWLQLEFVYQLEGDEFDWSELNPMGLPDSIENRIWPEGNDWSDGISREIQTDTATLIYQWAI